MCTVFVSNFEQIVGNFAFCAYVDGAGRIERMESDAVDIAAEEQRASERIHEIDAKKIQQLGDLKNRTKVRHHTYDCDL